MIQAEAFEALASSSKGIAKLRELILELAVCGLLVPQDPNDEPAKMLIERIKEKKALLVKEGKIKAQEMLQPVGDGEIEFNLPINWKLTRIGDLLTVIRGASPRPKGDPKYFSVDRTPYHWIKISDIKKHSKDKILYDTDEFLTEAGMEKSVLLPKGTLVMTNSATIGIPIFLGFNGGCIHDGYLAFPYFPDDNLSSDFFFILLKTLKSHAVKMARGMAQLNLNTGIVRNFPLGLPPLNEQRRIVAKVNELMALCDQLEQHQNHSSTVHQRLLQTLLESLTQAADNEAFQKIWSQITAHFDTLFTTEASIDQLKQVILQLAVMGKLVPQDPNDEPASELFKRIQAEKAKLIAEGKIKKAKPLPPITDEEKPFDLPMGWKWVRFGEISTIKAELVRPEDFEDFRQVAPDCIEKGTGRLTEVRTVREAGVRGPNSRFYKGQIVYSKIRPSLSKVVLVDFDGLCSADMYPIDTFIDSKFLLKQILSEFFLKQVRIAENRIKMPKLNQESLTAFVLPIPSISEQHRIVTKVDELMAICDQLKSRISKSQQIQEHLATAIIEKAAT